MHTTIPYKHVPFIHTLRPHHIFGQRHKPTQNKVYSLIIAPPSSYEKRPARIAASPSTVKIQSVLKYEAAAEDPVTGLPEESCFIMAEANQKAQQEKIPSQTLSGSLITLRQRTTIKKAS